jgi:hypothetical protein
MYIESQYALQQFDMPKALDSYKLFLATYQWDAAAWNNLATAYAIIGDYEQAAKGRRRPGRSPAGTTPLPRMLPRC